MNRTMFAQLGVSVIVVFISVGWTTQHRTAEPLFAPAPNSPIAVGAGSGELVLADLNRDGHLDLLSKHLLTQNLTVRLGNGKGAFVPAPESSIKFAYQPGAIETGDINSDGILDVAVASRVGDKELVNVFLGDGKAGFRIVGGTPYTVSKSMETYKPDLWIADINEDGKLDLVTSNGRRNRIEILFGDGRGGFTIGPSVTLVPGQNRYYSALGDVDRDGHFDVVTVSSVEEGGAGRLSIRRGDGKGGFADAPGLALSDAPNSRLAALTDVNGDKYPDIVLSHSSSHLGVMLNSGKGTFSAAPNSPFNIGREAFAVVVADVNGDKKNDLVAATVNSVTILVNDRGGFVPAPGSPFRAGPGAYNVTVGDLNEDGKPDVAASSFEGDGVTLLLGR